MLEKIILFFLFFLPFQFALHPVEGVDLALVRVVAIIIFLLWLARSLLRKSVLFPQPLPLFFFFSYLLWASLSLFWSENTDWALRKALFILSLWPLFLLFFSFTREKNFREKAYKSLVLGAILISALSLIQFFSQFIFGVEQVFSFWTRVLLPFFLGPDFGATVASYPSLLVNISGNTLMRAIGFFPDPHMLSFFLGMTFPLAIAHVFHGESRKRKFWIFGAGIILLADLLTFSRGGYVGLFFGMGAFFLPLFLQSITWRRQLVRLGLPALFLVSLIFLSPVGTRFFSSFSGDDGSNVERLRLWQEAGNSIIKYPLLGTGLGNYSLSVKPTASYREPIYVHNLYLDVAVELGLVGLFFFGGFLFLGVFSALRKWRKEQDIFSLALFSSLIVFSAHSFFETPLFSVHIVPLLLFLVAGSVL